MSGQDVEIIGQEICYQGFFRLERLRLRHRLFAGGMSPAIVRETIEKGDVAAVLLYDPQRDEVVMIEQFRIGARADPRGPWLLEIVAGLIEDGETPAAVACREAMEEAGCTVTDLLPISSFYTSPAKTSQRTHLYLGRVDSRNAGGIHGLAHEGEDIRVVCLAAGQAVVLAEQGRIDSAWPLVALWWFARHHQEVRQRWLAESR
ncbi:MAG: NUDIX domain-containing protein [Candidatus Accumulibacter phosphatis]|uniref:NUDIX domain-containing protein n=1 Tax=Accumulibacter sp. TaxID=2053492 RepID=UPI002A5C2184|nr:NUDIX domain-containing protein [Accumulibacter sp.]MCQ1547581.1 NUDIX domain-containing protein [Candidatus Accumulibacter phosphatis]HMW56952.1 NUDIX domain-containing protein [Accumulibacter sp.]HNC21292.1 NUDIX domain-containing protein [Accumulibacter sp.]